MIFLMWEGGQLHVKFSLKAVSCTAFSLFFFFLQFVSRVVNGKLQSATEK